MPGSERTLPMGKASETLAPTEKPSTGLSGSSAEAGSARPARRSAGRRARAWGAAPSPPERTAQSPDRLDQFGCVHGLQEADLGREAGGLVVAHPGEDDDGRARAGGAPAGGRRRPCDRRARPPRGRGPGAGARTPAAPPRPPRRPTPPRRRCGRCGGAPPPSFRGPRRRRSRAGRPPGRPGRSARGSRPGPPSRRSAPGLLRRAGRRSHALEEAGRRGGHGGGGLGGDHVPRAGNDQHALAGEPVAQERRELRRREAVLLHRPPRRWAHGPARAAPWRRSHHRR